MVILKADEGRVYTNGETYGKNVFLPDSADIQVWYQIYEYDIPSQDEPSETDKDEAPESF